MTDPNVAAALDFYRQMWADGQIPPGAQADTGTDFANAFTTGKIGMTGSGAFAISHAQERPPGDRLRRHLPAGQGRRPVLLRRRRQHRHPLRLQVPEGSL